MTIHHYHTAIHSIHETGDATFYLINTTPNRNKWSVTDKALEEALPTILNKPLGSGPDYKTDQHYPDPIKLGEFHQYKKPDSYALATAHITDQTAWTKLTTGEWGPISVVIKSYRETCSNCNENLTQNPDPFQHKCIVEGKAHIQVESFVFDRVDFIDNPAYPQAGYLHTANTPNTIPLDLLAQFYEANPQASGSPTPTNPATNQKENQMTQETQETRISQLEQQLSDEKKLRENLETQLNEILAKQHTKQVEETLQARTHANLVTDPATEQELLNQYSEEFLNQLKTDALKITETQPNPPKTKNHQANATELQEAIETTRTKLFGPRRNN